VDRKEQQHKQDINAVSTRKFSEMTPGQKLRHVWRVGVFLLTFGFVYPNIFSE